MAVLAEELKRYVKEESLRKTFGLVFDKQTISALHSLAARNYFDVLEFVVSTGKEAMVFRAVDTSGNFRAVKIYKIKTSGFRHMTRYLEGDLRFKEVSSSKQGVIYQWTKKEFKNLERMHEVGIRVPRPLAFKDNVLVMEFIGNGGVAAKTLKEDPIKDLSALYETITDYMARLVEKAKLVHADLSEYNILNFNEQPVLIDCAQAVLTSHPHAKEFFERDVRNMANYFTKSGFPKSFEEMYGDIRGKKES